MNSPLCIWRQIRPKRSCLGQIMDNICLNPNKKANNFLSFIPWKRSKMNNNWWFFWSKFFSTLHIQPLLDYPIHRRVEFLTTIRQWISRWLGTDIWYFLNRDQDSNYSLILGSEKQFHGKKRLVLTPTGKIPALSGPLCLCHNIIVFLWSQ